MKKYTLFSILATILLLLTSCNKEIDDSSVDILSEANLITAINFKNGSGDAVTPYFQEIIQENNEIIAKFPFGVDVSSLMIEVTLSENAILQNDTSIPINFTQAQTLVVLAENEVSNTYSIQVESLAVSQRQALLNMYTPERVEEEFKWDLDADISTWSGVVVKDGNVVGISQEGDFNSISSPDENLQYLPYLKDIIITDASFSLPFELDVIFSHLETIDFEVTLSVIELPSWVARQPNLKSIRFQDTVLKTLPENIGDLQNLESLELYLTGISSFPESFKNLKNLKNLNLSNTKISKVPEFFTELTGLEILNLRNNDNLLSIPESICEFGKTLETFEIEDNVFCEGELSNVDRQTLALLRMLEEGSGANWDVDLPLEEWDFIELDKETGNVIGYSFDGFKNSFCDPIINFNENMKDLPYLTSISLLGSKMVVFPPNDNVYLSNITSLQIRSSKLEEISEYIVNLENLEELIFDDIVGAKSPIDSLPEEIVALENLKLIKFGNSNFTKLQGILGQLPSLVEIDYMNNGLTEVSSEIVQSNSLKTLSLRAVSLNLNFLPNEICDFGNREGNTLTTFIPCEDDYRDDFISSLSITGANGVTYQADLGNVTTRGFSPKETFVEIRIPTSVDLSNSIVVFEKNVFANSDAVTPLVHDFDTNEILEILITSRDDTARLYKISIDR